MSANKKRQIRQSLLGVGLSLTLAGCGSSNNPTTSSVAAPPAPVTIGGAVADGPVAGGTLFVFAPSQVQVALATVDPEGDRRAALVAASPIATLNRDSADEGEFELPIPGTSADSIVFLIFDNADAEDLEFHDTPPNLESVVLLGATGRVIRTLEEAETEAGRVPCIEPQRRCRGAQQRFVEREVERGFQFPRTDQPNFHGPLS